LHVTPLPFAASGLRISGAQAAPSKFSDLVVAMLSPLKEHMTTLSLYLYNSS
jgi:hypothetical protein